MTIHLVDVGARDGIPDRWVPFYDDLDVLAFEPDSVECARLNARKWPYRVRHLPNALGARDNEQATLYITKAPGCSSLLLPNMELCRQYPYGENLEVVSTQHVTLSRMDSVAGSYRPDVMKIDTQGTELSILQGAGSLLDTTIAVELEVEFVPLYQNQPLFADVDAFMRSRGFTLRGLRRSCWRQIANHYSAQGGQIIHGDVLYLKHDLLNTPTGHQILAAYNQHDLLASFGVRHTIPESLGTRIARRFFSRWDGRVLRGWLDKLHPVNSTDWHDANMY